MTATAGQNMQKAQGERAVLTAEGSQEFELREDNLRREIARQAKELATLVSLIEAEREQRGFASKGSMPSSTSRDPVLNLVGELLGILKKRLESEIGKKVATQVLCSALEDANFVDEEWYYTTYPDVKKAKIPSVAHYLDHGSSEGRLPNPAFRDR